MLGRRRDHSFMLTFHGEELRLLEGMIVSYCDVLRDEEDQLSAPSAAGGQPTGTPPSATGTELDGLDEPFEPEPGSSELFDAWEAEFAEPAGVPADPPDAERDPVIQRLFPDAYPDDPRASAEFRGYTQSAQLARRLEQADIVLEDLAATNRKGECQLPVAHLDAWLKTLNAVNLAITARIGIVDAISAGEIAKLPDDDPRAWLFHVYQWMAAVLESILELTARDE